MDPKGFKEEQKKPTQTFAKVDISAKKKNRNLGFQRSDTGLAITANKLFLGHNLLLRAGLRFLT